jgi:coproporphyrinogen III oxidase
VRTFCVLLASTVLGESRYHGRVTATRSSSAAAASAIILVEQLQQRMRLGLEALAGRPFESIAWLRDDGRHGGGVRYSAAETSIFNRVAINVSHVHYDDEPNKPLRSATALSTIIHPDHPRAPSVHIHVSWTERKHGPGYWRVMADLNPAIVDEPAKQRFATALRDAAVHEYEHASAQGDRYFYIPALGRHRGVTHFYLEGHATADPEADRALARRVGEAAIDAYLRELGEAREPTASDADRALQLAYHTLYLFQVLTLDRGTTSGILVHDQNDLGIMGSLPAFVDRERLASWIEVTPAVQRPLVRAIVATLPDGSPSHVDDRVRAQLAEVVRRHYREHPEATGSLAAGDILPPTVENHGDGHGRES